MSYSERCWMFLVLRFLLDVRCRTNQPCIAGAETDLVLISPNGTLTCIEIKYATAPAIAKGFYQSVADLKPGHQYVIVPTGTPYFLKDHLKVRSLPDFLANELAVIK